MAGVARQISPTEAAVELNLAGQSVRKTGGLMKILAVGIAAETKVNFDLGRSPDDVPWRPLAHKRPRSKGTDLPLRDRGLLMASVTGKAEGHVERIGETDLTVGTSLIYAGLHQRGGTVTPKRGKYLAIPLTREAVTAGSPRRFPRPLFPRFGKRGGVMLALIGAGKRAKEVAQYALVKSVTVPARPFLGFGARMLARIERLTLDWLARTFGGGT